MKITKLVLSLLALANVVFVPVYDVWGGLFPKSPEDNFFDVIGYVLKGEFDYYVVLFTLAILIPSLFMFIVSFFDIKELFIAASGAGIAFIMFALFNYVADCGLEELLNLDDGSVSVGTWIALVVFVVSLFVAIFSNQKQATQKAEYINNPNNQTVNSVRMKFCPRCGSAIDADSVFCGQCGSKIKK